MAGVNKQRLRELLDERGITPRALSRAVGDNAYLVRDILSGKSRNARADTLAKLAKALDVPLGDLLDSEDSAEGAADPRLIPRYLPVRYRVQAGHWVEIDAEEPPVQVSMAVVPDPRYSNWPQWLELVQGDSVNVKIPSGHYAHVVDAGEMGYAPKNGDWVVVERRRDHGRIRERTIKQIEIGPDRLVRLCPRSTNPKWSEHASLAIKNGQAVMAAGEALPEGDEIEVEIVGLVIGAYNPEF
jgi:transcriptional regulator with XRE-family HTH domain